MRILFVEPEQAENFSPIALARPVFELLCGTRSVRRRVLEISKPDSWGVTVRPHLEDIYRLEHPEAHVNDPDWIAQDDVVIVNGLWVGDPRHLEKLSADNPVLECQGRIAALYLVQGESSFDEKKLRESVSAPFAAPVKATEKPFQTGSILNYPWELIKNNGEMINLDFDLFRYNQQASLLPENLSQLLPPDEQTRIYIDPQAELEPFVSVNAQNGPVIVEADVKIQSFTRLEGPCFIGKQTQLFRANIREETSIGPVCRVGGEIEGSIIHGFANKYHDGFLGHSYVCPWVNLGALTTNSDLKNDYSNVKIPIGQQYLDTGERKVGCFIGDHAKTAIGTLFNTGSNIGVMAMVLPAGKLCPKHIPSFSRLWHGQLDDECNFDAACQTAAIAMGRRNHDFTVQHRKLFMNIRNITQPERTAVCG